jgi:hypothetical protein
MSKVTMFVYECLLHNSGTIRKVKNRWSSVYMKSVLKGFRFLAEWHYTDLSTMILGKSVSKGSVI